jgi:hypothetical protein
MNFSLPQKAAGKTARRGALRAGLAGFAVVAATGAATLAAPAMSALAAGPDNTATAIDLGTINTMPFGTFTFNVPVTVTDTTNPGTAPIGTVVISAPAANQSGGTAVAFTGCTITLTAADDGAGNCNVTTPQNAYGFVLIEADFVPADTTAFNPSSAGDTSAGQPEVKIINLMPTETTVGPATAAPGTVDLVAHVVPIPALDLPANTNILNANSETLPDLVSFTLNGAPIGACTNVKLGPAATDPTTNNGPNFADCDVTLAAGTYTVVATFSGDEYANTSTVTQTVTVKTPAPAPTTTKMSTASGQVDSKITLSAKVTGSSPTGTVKFVQGSSTLCSATLSNGTAKCTHTFTAVGSHTVEAMYMGNATHAASHSTVTVTVKKQSTSVKVTASNASKGKAVTLTATVKSLTAATGTVTFYVNGHKVGTAKVSGGKASFKYTWNATGTYKVTASYGGNSTHLASKGTVSVKVG